ncbi:hypothetical protein D3C81_1258980 [compost metagenome]
MVRLALELLFDGIERFHLITYLRQLVLQMGDAPLRQQRWITISPIQLGQIARDALVQQFATRLDLAGGEVPLSAVHGLELASVDRNHSMREDLHVPTQCNEATAH